MSVTQDMPAVGRWREPVIPDFPTTREQVEWSRNRPPGARTALPQVGEIVGLRMQAYGPVLPCKVVDDGMTPPADTRPGAEIDWNVWRYVVTGYGQGYGPVTADEAGNREIELVDDPWPHVLLEAVDGSRLRVATREARLPGSTGWLREKE